MISKKEVQHIAYLARIELSPQELEEMQKELGKILEYIEQLKEVKVENLPPAFHLTNSGGVFRQDLPQQRLKEEGEKLINLSPQKEKRFIKIKTVFS